MLKAKHNFLLYRFFRFYVIRKMKASFHSCKIQGDIEDKNLPILLICNHTSWWDGIWAFYVNEKLFRRKFYFMMLEEQLQKNWFFKYTGGFSITKNSKSVIETLNYSANLLQEKSNLVLLFPQGKMYSMHYQDFIFKKGVEKILTKTGKNIQVIFLANIIDYFENVKPNVFLNITEYTGEFNINAIEISYNEFYKKCIETQIQIQV